VQSRRIAALSLIGAFFATPVGASALAPNSSLTQRASLAKIVPTSGAVPQKISRCRDFSIGPAGFSNILVAGVTCPVAKRLLDRTTLSRVRRNRTVWTYGGFRWWFIPVDEVSAKIVGTSGVKLVTADFAVA
jgi:hypothetical protein